ncbi:MAG: hypothetical protein HFG35_10245 [Eubacterium sp.]|nr:hypothetical protein [Eubacterium sp.]
MSKFLYQQKIINSLIFIESIQSVNIVAMPEIVFGKLYVAALFPPASFFPKPFDTRSIV